MREYRRLAADKTANPNDLAAVEQTAIFYAGWLGHYVAELAGMSLNGCIKQLITTSRGSRKAIKNLVSGKTRSRTGTITLTPGFLSTTNRSPMALPRDISAK